MASEQQKHLKKELLRKDKLELVKLLKKKKLATNGSKADMVDRILANDEKTGGTMARKASKAAGADVDDDSGDDDEEYDSDDDDDDDDDESEEEEEEQEPKKKPKPKPKKKKKKKKKNNAQGGGGGGGAAIECEPIDCSGCSVDSGGGFGLVAQIFTAIAVIGQLIIGIIQFVNLVQILEDVCDVDNSFIDCFGPSLFWDVGGDGTDSMNVWWRSVFTFAPTIFFENWTPTLFGLLAAMQMFTTTKWDIISGTWFRCMLFHLVMCLFAAFPYCGKVGIIFGFVEAIAGFFCLICVGMRLGGPTYITFSF